MNESAQLPPNNPQSPQLPPYVPVPLPEHVQQPPPEAIPFVLAPQVNQGVPIQPVAFDHNVVIPNPVAPSPVVDSKFTEHDARFVKLEGYLKKFRGMDDFLFDVEDSESEIATKLLPKFKMPDMEKYNGIGSPKIHLRLYRSLMSSKQLDEQLLVKLFPLSLTGATQRWYYSISPSRLRTWDDLMH